MKNSLNKFLLIILFILNVSCESKTGGSTITISSECNNGQSLGCDGICSSSPLENDCSGECGGDAEEDECGVCEGEITILSECPLLQCASDVCISIQNVNLSSNTLEVWMLNNISVAGYQFNISGITIISASGGSAQSNGMSPNIGENIILGFSFSGDAIPPGNGVLTQLVFSESSGSICLSLPVFSNNSGEALSVELGECF
jgi:hypothetical protein